MANLRDLPSVNELLESETGGRYIAEFGRGLVIEAFRFALDEARAKFHDTSTIPTQEELFTLVADILTDWTEPTLQPVINATGVIIHTNLGRAPLSQSAVLAMQQASSGYSTLEYDLRRGKRGSRLVHAEEFLKRLTGADAALVVNNNAAAVLLVLTALARRRKVVIARSQLVEIGGGFRVPDVMKQSGAKLFEVGTTNRVHLTDYEAALQDETLPAMVMRAHRSNFQIVGFTSEPEFKDIVDLAHQFQVTVADDLGSGSLLDTGQFGIAHEPMVQESLQAGADLVCFSGDKLLGGPQAGIIVGHAHLVAKLKKHPLARAVRADKLCLSALSATLIHYLKGEALTHIPIWQMISATEDKLRERVTRWSAELGAGQVISGLSTVGGGSLPGQTLPTALLALSPKSPDRFQALLRQSNPAIIARVEGDQVVFDPRTVLPGQEQILLQTLQALQ